MAKRLTWRPTKKQRQIIARVVVAVGVVALILIAYYVPWAGFDAYTPIKSGDVEIQREKTLWDWLGVLIIPAVLAFGGIWYSNQDRKKDREIAADSQRDAALHEYLDRMADLILAHDLRAVTVAEEVRLVARARTLTVLRTLGSDGTRKGNILQFLFEAELIKTPDPIVSLYEADLRQANLKEANLSKANLSGTNMRGADLTRASLSEAKLEGAVLTGAVLQEALMRNVNLSATILSTANLSGAFLREADLSGTDLRGADLSYAKLNKADLSGSLLNNANLSWADLTGAKMDRAGLVGVDLSHAILTDSTATPEQLAYAKSLKAATMPDGSKHD